VGLTLPSSLAKERRHVVLDLLVALAVAVRAQTRAAMAPVNRPV